MNDNRQELIRESLKQSEEIIRSQLTIAIASDSRALTFSGLTLAAASVLAGFADQAALSVAMYVASGMLFAAGAISAWTAMPVAWHPPGQLGGDFADDIAQNRPMGEVMLEMASFNDAHFHKNESVRAGQSRWLKCAAMLAGLAAPTGVLVQCVAWSA